MQQIEALITLLKGVIYDRYMLIAQAPSGRNRQLIHLNWSVIGIDI
jgi:hypothetical protein